MTFETNASETVSAPQQKLPITLARMKRILNQFIAYNAANCKSLKIYV